MQINADGIRETGIKEGDYGCCRLWLRSFASCLVRYDYSVLVMLELHVLSRAMVISGCHEWVTRQFDVA